MFTTKVIALLALLASTATAGSFDVLSFKATDKHGKKKESHSISLTVARGFQQDDGYWPHKCAIKWKGDSVPSCYKTCDAKNHATFYARVVPDTFVSASQFSVEILEFYHGYIDGSADSVDKLNSGTFNVTQGKDGYACSKGEKKDVCEDTHLPGEVAEVDFVKEYPATRPEHICK